MDMTIDAYEQFVRARTPALLRTAYLLTGDQHLAEDLVQEALSRTHRAWPRLRDGGNVEAYTRKVMYHAQVSRWRRRRVAEAMPGVLPDVAGRALAITPRWLRSGSRWAGLGQVVGPVAGVGSDITGVGGIEAAKGAVRVEVTSLAKVLAGSSTPDLSAVRPWRTFAWDGTRFTQIAGSTTFAADQSAAKLTGTATRLVFDPPDGACRSGELTLTVRNDGPRAAADVTAAVILPENHPEPCPNPPAGQGYGSVLADLGNCEPATGATWTGPGSSSSTDRPRRGTVAPWSIFRRRLAAPPSRTRTSRWRLPSDTARCTWICTCQRVTRRVRSCSGSTVAGGRRAAGPSCPRPLPRSAFTNACSPADTP
jgi:hypothetical protein